MAHTSFEGEPRSAEIDLSNQQAVYAEVFRLVQQRKTAEAEELTQRWLAANPVRKN